MTQLHPNRMKMAEHERVIWTVVPEHGTPFEALLDPAYWAHVSAKLAPWARIEVTAEDGSYFAELLVQDAGKLYAKVFPLRKVDLAAVEVTNSGVAADGHEVKWSGPHSKWRALRGVDVLKDGFSSKAEAQVWLANHIRAVAA